MKKIIILAVFVLILVAVAGVFLWQDQKEVRELNKNLPKGVKVVKSLIGQEYKVVNKIDGYSFKIPRKWGGIEEIKYAPEGSEQGYTSSSLGLSGKEGESRIVAIDHIKMEKSESDLEVWAKNYFNAFGLIGFDFHKEKIGQLETVKTQEDTHFLGMYVYFFQRDNVVYAIVGGSEEFIREIIASGKW